MKISRNAIRQRLADAYHLPMDGFWLVWGSTWNARLSALDNRDYIEQMLQACQTIQALSQQGLSQVRLIYKDRPTPDIPLEQMRDGFQAIAKALGLRILLDMRQMMLGTGQYVVTPLYPMTPIWQSKHCWWMCLPSI